MIQYEYIVKICEDGFWYFLVTNYRCLQKLVTKYESGFRISCSYFKISNCFVSKWESTLYLSRNHRCMFIIYIYIMGIEPTIAICYD